MSETRNLVIPRIVVTCDTSPLGSAALAAAAALARQLDAELAGLFVEDINLLRMAALPFAREYALASAAARRVEAAELERSLRLQADALRKALARAAQASRVPWSFQVMRGALLDSVLEMMREPDLAVFGCTGQYAIGVAAIAPGRSVHETMPTQPILTIYDDTPASERALVAAQSLAQVHHTGLVALVVATDAAGVRSLRERAAAQLRGRGAMVHFHGLTARDSRAIKQVVETYHAAALLWHGVQTPQERKTFATLVDALKCPVILVT